MVGIIHQRFQDFILFDNVGYITSKLKEKDFILSLYQTNLIYPEEG